MVPAMDRSAMNPARSIWIGVALALASGDLGCSELKSQIWGTNLPPAELGQVVDSSDTYTLAHRPRTAGDPVASGAGTASPILAQVEEVGAAIRPAESASPRAAPGVALQTPAPLDARPDPRPSTAGAGVPNAARILASVGRPSESKPTATPAEIVQEARAALDALATYQVDMHRQERVNGSLLPEEDVVIAVRRAPKAVRLTWPSGPNQGREVLYRADEPKGQMHVKMANAALPRLSLDPESPMVMRNSRHPVTEAGFDSLIVGLENALNVPAESEIAYKGLETPEGFDEPLHCLSRTTPSGEKWQVYLDPRSHLPALVHVVDLKGELLERYAFRDLRPNPADLASSDAFDPTARWGQPRGLFGRLAGGDRPDDQASPR
jgi:hypothetical protein